MFALYLNDMRAAHSEDMVLVAVSDDKLKLLTFVTGEQVPSYVDAGEHTIVHDTDFVAANAGGPVHERVPTYRWGKCFRKGGPLEWFNGKPGPVESWFTEILDEETYVTRATEAARQQYRNHVSSVRRI